MLILTLLQGVVKMSLRDRLALGVNFFSVAKAAKELMSDPNFQPTTKREFAEKVLEKITSKSLPQLQEAGISLEEILAFIEAILPLIIQIITIFI